MHPHNIIAAAAVIGYPLQLDQARGTAFITHAHRACVTVAPAAMPPKKSEAELRHDFRAHAQWAEANLDMLRARDGHGLKAKLRQHNSHHEKLLHNWLSRYGAKENSCAF